MREDHSMDYSLTEQRKQDALNEREADVEKARELLSKHGFFEINEGTKLPATMSAVDVRAAGFVARLSSLSHRLENAINRLDGKAGPAPTLSDIIRKNATAVGLIQQPDVFAILASEIAELKDRLSALEKKVG